MANPGTFSLRLHDDGLRTLVRELAERRKMSQNEFIETAVTREVVMLGARVAVDLESAAKRLRELTDEQYAALVSRSADEFAYGESGPDPLQATAFHFTDLARPFSQDADPFGIDAAFLVGLDAPAETVGSSRVAAKSARSASSAASSSGGRVAGKSARTAKSSKSAGAGRVVSEKSSGGRVVSDRSAGERSAAKSTGGGLAASKSGRR